MFVKKQSKLLGIWSQHFNSQEAKATILQTEFFRVTDKHFVTERYLPADGLAPIVQVIVWFGMIWECLLFE